MAIEKEELIAKIKELLKPEVTKISYDTWIMPLDIRSIDGNHIVFTANSEFQKDFIENKYKSLIFNTLRYITNKDWTFSVVDLTKEEKDDSKDIISNTSNSSPAEIEMNKSTLNPKYTFETFVVGNNNRFAHAAALAVGNEPAKSYNPLYLYGGVGLGKTHLMHAIGNFVLSQNKDAKVLYITSEKFTNELINAIQKNTNEEFRDKYRNIDLLLIDDIQFFIGKERCQEEFFHTFNALYENGKQIVISSDKPPKDINPLEERLKSRFEWGLVADIGKPDYETRYAILRQKAQNEKIYIDDEILSMIAVKVESNIRELEGILNKMIAWSSLTNGEITMELAEKEISNLHQSKEKVITVDYIQNIVAKYYNLNQNDFKIQRKTSDIAFPRQIAMYLSKQLTGASLKEIGKEFGGKDHSTVIYAIKKIEDTMEVDPNTKIIVDNIRKMILS